MPSQKRYKCLRCEAEFELLVFTHEEQIAARRHNPNQGFGRATCPNPQCQSTDVIEKAKLMTR